MSNEGTETKKTWLHKLVPSVFIVISFYLIAVVYHSGSSLYEQLSNRSDLLVFKKGDFYMFGVAIGLLFGSLGIIMENFYASYYTKIFQKLNLALLLLGLLVMFLFPQILHFYVADFTETHGYTKCERNSYQAMKFKTYIYAKHQTDCEDSSNKRT